MNCLFIRKSVYDELLEKGYGKRDLSKLQKKEITNKNGKKQTVYVKNDKLPQNETKGKTTETTMQNNSSKFDLGQTISFEYGGNTLFGEIKAKGKDGVVVEDKNKRTYNVRYNKINKVLKNTGDRIPSEIFSATDYKKSFTDPKVTPDSNGVKYIYNLLGKDGEDALIVIEGRLLQQAERLKNGDTKTRNQINGNYSPKRLEIHQKIIDKILSPEKIKNARPKNGEKPKYIVFGGRGGSGKSWFTDKKRAKAEGREVMFDSDKYIILDADAIKEMLPEYKGWNAGEVHEESSDLMKRIKKIAMQKGLNIIIDGTMGYNKENPNKVKNDILNAKNNGYSTEAHYMFTPIQKSCINAIERFKTKKGDWSGRLVPMITLVNMQDNEKSFDSVKDIVDDWSFRDNQNFEAKIISQKSK